MKKVKNGSDQVKACSEFEGTVVAAEPRVEADSSQPVNVRTNSRFVPGLFNLRRPDSYIKRGEKTTFAAMPQAE